MKFVKSLIPDLVMIAGWAAMSYGAWIIYPPAGFLLGGGLALLAGIKMASA
jgi:hypothetical protein